MADKPKMLRNYGGYTLIKGETFSFLLQNLIVDMQYISGEGSYTELHKVLWDKDQTHLQRVAVKRLRRQFSPQYLEVSFNQLEIFSEVLSYEALMDNFCEGLALSIYFLSISTCWIF